MKSRIGITRAGVVYELFLTNLPQSAFTSADVVALYLHRGAFETTLADEDQELDPDRWCSHTANGQEIWQIVAQWAWNLRLELGHQLHPDPVRTTEFAPATPPTLPHAAPPSGYAPAFGGLVLESWSLFRARFFSATRWHAALSGWTIPLRP
jgi:hypothetical protein